MINNYQNVISVFRPQNQSSHWRNNWFVTQDALSFRLPNTLLKTWKKLWVQQCGITFLLRWMDGSSKWDSILSATTNFGQRPVLAFWRYQFSFWFIFVPLIEREARVVLLGWSWCEVMQLRFWVSRIASYAICLIDGPKYLSPQLDVTNLKSRAEKDRCYFNMMYCLQNG